MSIKIIIRARRHHHHNNKKILKMYTDVYCIPRTYVCMCVQRGSGEITRRRQKGSTYGAIIESLSGY